MRICELKSNNIKKDNWRHIMDIQSSQQSFNDELDLERLTKRDEKKLVLSTEAERMANSILTRRHRMAELNKNIDPTNTAIRYPLGLETKDLRSFKHFLTKNKHRNERLEVMQIIRELAEQKKYVLNGRVKDKLQRSRMVLRVISKQDLGVVIVQDETGKQKMIVRNGTIWVGMIALMQVSWSDNCYKLQAVLDLGTRAEKVSCELKLPHAAYRMLFVKGSFMNNQSRDNIGLKIILNEIRNLRDREKTKINSLVIMGPLLNRKNKALNEFMQQTYEEQIVKLNKLIRDEINNISEQIEIVFVPSTEDITNYYPIPQPKYSHYVQNHSKTNHFTSNPGFIKLLSAKESIKIDLINMDLLNYIDENRTGRSVIEIMQENLQTYFKQPFYLTNALQQPFDETNLPALYNSGNFGDIIVTSSNKSPPFAREVRGKVFLNIGSLRMQEDDENQKHFMTIVSIFEGTGSLSSRTKVEKLEM